MAKIKDLPLNERPREKALLKGINSLSNSELLSIIIANGTKNQSALEVSNNILSKVGGIENLYFLNLNDLLSIKGISKVKALSILASLELSKRASTNVKRINITLEYIVNYFHKLFEKEKQEKGYIILLDKNSNLLFIRELFSGNEYSLSFSTKLVISFIVQYDAKKYYLIHNHPSGSPNPSKDDLITTSSIELITMGMSCHLVDHLIFGEKSYYSIAKHKEFLY